MNSRLKQINSLLGLIYNHILNGAACLAIYKQFRHEEALEDKFNQTKEANIFHLIADSTFKNAILYMAHLFDKSKTNEKCLSFRLLEQHMLDNNMLNQLKKQNKSKLSKPFDDIYSDFQSKLKTVKEGNNPLVKKVQTARNKLIAHKEIKCSEAGEYAFRLSSYGISYEDAEDCIKFIFELFDAASLLIDTSETGWEFFQQEVAETAKNFFKKLRQYDR